MLDPIEFGKHIAVIIRDAQAPLLERIKALEAQVAERPLQGPAGERGLQGERGDPGATGERGLDGSPGALGEKGERGEAGPQGEPGRDAEPINMADLIAQVLAGDELKAIISLEVAEAMAAVKVEPGKDGRDGKDGERGLAGEHGEKGEAGSNGKDGAGIADLLIDRDGALVATMTDGRTKSLGVVIGKDGAPGKDGADFSEASIDYDGERTVTIRGKGGEITKRVPVPIDRGYWTDGSAAEKGDVYTHNGSVWIALRDTKAKPCHENKDDWRLMVRKGRDGADGKNGRDLGPAPPVKLTGTGNA